MSVSDHSSQLFKGLGLMAFAMMILPCMDAIAKYMATFQSVSPGQVTFYRFLFQMVLTLPLLLMGSAGSLLRAKRPWVNMFRGVLHAAATLLFFTAVKYMPLADVFAIYFVEPFMLTAMSALILGEKVGIKRWIAILIGFGGAMIVIQPSYAIFGIISLLPVTCAFLFALYLFLNRVVGEADPPSTMQMLSGLGGTLFMAIVLAAGDRSGFADFQISLPASLFSLCLLLLLGGLSGYGHLLVVKAFRLAPLSVLAPFQYFEIISASVLGFLFFNEFPTLSKWIGVAIIVGSGLFIIITARKAEPVSNQGRHEGAH
jgi:drug/metabolite transporter (DMT)-like permease